jgi:hypothetical protein
LRNYDSSEKRNASDRACGLPQADSPKRSALVKCHYDARISLALPAYVGSMISNPVMMIAAPEENFPLHSGRMAHHMR